MSDETNRMTITTEDGTEAEVEILFTFDHPDGRHFVLFTDPNDLSDEVYAYTYDDDGNMEAVSDEADLEMCSEVLGAFTTEDEGDTGYVN